MVIFAVYAQRHNVVVVERTIANMKKLGGLEHDKC